MVSDRGEQARAFPQVRSISFVVVDADLAFQASADVVDFCEDIGLEPHSHLDNWPNGHSNPSSLWVVTLRRIGFFVSYAQQNLQSCGRGVASVGVRWGQIYFYVLNQKPIL